ncbi:MAG TPA: GAK system ATP-grasp enzyme [Piscirickettsiaceae bacterium]|nr:GAK system ATP-grasp enzyme [Piscirickettsiaceae bacterium]HIQ39739.1 GAK system ATP-grasp enzyme [Sulfurivirga caldicuralii]
MPNPELKIAVIGLPGKWSSETLADALAERTGWRCIIDPARLQVDLVNNRVHADGLNLCELDGVMIKKIGPQYSPLMLDRLELLRFVEQCGVRLFSRPGRIMRLVDRLAGTLVLRQGDIPMPPTIITEQIEEAIEYIHQFGQAILKPLYSTKAKGMVVLNARKLNHKQLKSRLAAFKAQHGLLYIQQKLELPGQDMGLVFLNGAYMGAYARIKGNKWHTATSGGGKYAPAQPTAETIAIAQRAQALFGLDYTTVDMAETEMGPVCFEVSAFGGFRGALEGLNLNMAHKFADFAVQCLQSP